MGEKACCQKTIRWRRRAWHGGARGGPQARNGEAGERKKRKGFMQNKNRRRTARMRPAAVAAPNLSAEEDCMVTADEALRPAAVRGAQRADCAYWTLNALVLIASARHRTIFAVLAMDGIFTVSSFMCEEASVDLYDDYLYGSMLGNEVAEMMGMVHQKKEV